VKIAILGGAGGAGASLVYNLAVSGRDLDVVVVDDRPHMVTSHLMDLEQVLELSPGCRLSSGGPGAAVDADIVVVLAAAPLTVNTSRLVYLTDNARIVDGIAASLPPSWPGILVMVTNPVDALVTRFQATTGTDRRRVLGYTINDSLRLRTGLARAFGVGPGAVEAWMVGEHGDACVALLDRVTVDGVPRTPTEAEAAAALEYQRTWYVRHVALDSGRSSTWTTGLGVSRMVLAIAGDTGELWPASIVLDGEYGIRGVAVSVPVTLDAAGAAAVHEWELTPEQLAALQASAALVGEITAGIGETAPA
jgi:malate/lactate dehydrogenase